MISLSGNHKMQKSSNGLLQQVPKIFEISKSSASGNTLKSISIVQAGENEDG